MLRLFQHRGLLDVHTVENVLTWQASGGFRLDAPVRMHGSDAGGRERLSRYFARPPFALERLHLQRRGEGREERILAFITAAEPLGAILTHLAAPR